VSASETEERKGQPLREQTVTGADSACEKGRPTWLEGLWLRCGKSSDHKPMQFN
jgi:hypothetical protein